MLPHNSHIHGCSDPDSHFLFDDSLFKAVGVHCDLFSWIESPLVGCSIVALVELYDLHILFAHVSTAHY